MKLLERIKEMFRSEPAVTYIIADDGRSILCRKCNRRSYNRKDIENKFCGLCGYHETPPHSQ